MVKDGNESVDINKNGDDTKKEKCNLERMKKMAVSAGVLYEVRGDAARRIIQELDNPTPDQLRKREEIKQQVKELARIVRLKAKK